MTNFARAAAGIAIVAVVGVGILVLNSRPPSPAATGAPSPSPAPSDAAPGIEAFTPYTSAQYGTTFGYPDDWTLHAAATRGWQASDSFGADDVSFADVFVSPEEDIALFVWEMPAGEGADVESVEGLTAWARTFCKDVDAPACAGFTQRAVPMCLNAGGDPCRGALLVPTAGQQWAFFVNWGTATLTSNPDRVTVVAIARDDSFPSAARYGGSVELLKSILTTMGVHPR
jgi:hypothetical protein